MFSRLFKTPKSSLQLFRKNQAAMLPNDAESPQFPSENFSSLPIIWKVGLAKPRDGFCARLAKGRARASGGLASAGLFRFVVCGSVPSDGRI